MKNLQVFLADFEAVLDKVIGATWERPASLDYLKELAKGAQLLATEIIKAGDFCAERLEQEDADSFSLMLFHFEWMEQAKSFLILWQEVLFQAQKAQVLSLEQKVGQEDLDRLSLQSKAVILAAADELKSYFQKEVERISRSKNGREKQIAKWLLQQNPYPVYRHQIAALPQQCLQLSEQFEELNDLSETLVQIKTQIHTTLSNCQSEIESAKNNAYKVLSHLETNIAEKITKLGAWLEDIEAELRNSIHIESFTDELAQSSNKLLSKMKVPVAADGGLIQLKEINFEKNVRLWLDSEILPLLNEVWEITETGNHALKMAILNIRNRATLLSNELKEGKNPSQDYDNLGQPLTLFLEKTSNLSSDFENLEKLIHERLNQSFGIFSIYHPNQNFLPFPLHSTINQFKTQQNKWLQGLQIWWAKRWNAFQNFSSIVKIEEELSISEKIVRFIQSRKLHSDNHHYSSIFLTKGYIGESFWVGRKKEFNRIETLIEQWKMGYRGAILLKGKRFSGKSLFGDLIVNRYFPKNYIRLSPNTNLKFQGRQLTTTFDLSESLAFIRKYSLPDILCLWIDDLELWGSPNIPLSKNVRTLCEYIDDYSGQIFFIVSMSNWLKNHLDEIHLFDNKFQTEINLDSMSEAEIREAILIRHGATHKHLVNSEGNQIGSKTFQKLTNRIHRSVDGNIGEALYQWSLSIEQIDEERVIFKNSEKLELPDFVNSDSGILLATLLTEKRSNEYRLRKIFGPPFKEKYSGILQRLLNVGILTRHLDGWLEVNEVVINDVGKILKRKGFLKS